MGVRHFVVCKTMKLPQFNQPSIVSDHLVNLLLVTGLFFRSVLKVLLAKFFEVIVLSSD